MNHMKRMLALILALVMIVGILPMSVLAAETTETVLDAAIFCSDVHGSTSDLTSVLGGVAKSGVDYSSIGFVGDTCLTVENTTSIVQSALSDTDIAVMFSYASSHDTEDGADIDEDWDYSGEVKGVSNYYLVYTIREDDVKTYSSAQTAAKAFTTWYSGLTDAQKTLPIFVMSHRPLHARRGGNQGGEVWTQAFNAAGATSDIVVFWAHNHTGENSTDTGYYYVAKGGTVNVATSSGSSSSLQNGTESGKDYEIAFTYMNAGYINANNQNPARLGVATTVQITASSLIFQDYNSSGAYTGNYAHNVTIERECASTVTPTTLTVEGITTSYYVGEKLITPDPKKVTITYSDGTTKTWSELGSDYTLTAVLKDSEGNEVTEYTFATAGTYTIYYEFKIGEWTGSTKEDPVTITVLNPYVTKVEITTEPNKTAYVTGETLDTTGLVLTATYNTGATAVVTPTSITGYDLSTEGTQTVRVNYYVDGTTYYDEYTIVVEKAIAADATLEKIEIVTDPEKLEYLLSQPLNITGMLVIATFSDGSTKTLSYGGFASNPTSGDYYYTITDFNMNVAKAQTVVVSYTYKDVTKTDTFAINVWAEDFEDEDTNVKVHVSGDYGVTDADVTTSTNTNVSTAISGVISGTNYVAYDIYLVFDTGYSETNTTKTVTLPIPSGVNNPVVYYVPASGAAEPVTIVSKTDTTITFETTHFSTYVVGESTEIDVPENQTQTGSVTTDGGTTTKTVYVLSSGNPSGSVLIADSATAGSVNLVANDGGDLSNIETTVLYGDCDGDGDSEYYIELTDTEKTNAVWTVSNSYRFANQGEYLRCSNGSLSVSSQYNNWSYSSNRLSYASSNGGNNGPGSSSTTYYLRYNSGWTVTTNSSSASSIYFYVPTEVEVDTSVTKSGTYSIEGEDLTSVVTAGSTANLSSNLIFTPAADNTATVESPVNVSTSAIYEIVTVDANGNTVDGDPNDIISKIENGVVTFSGKYGKALVKVSYTTDFGVVTDYITIEAKAPYYSIELHKANITYVAATAYDSTATYFVLNEDGTYSKAEGVTEENFSSGTYYIVSATVGDEITETIAIKGIEAGDRYGVWAVIKEYTSVYPNGNDLDDVEDDSIEWSSSDESIATVDPATGIITFTGKDGTFQITAEYTGADGKIVWDTITISVTTSQYSVPADGTSDFPEYPNEGAVRFDKTATAVGNFSETGIAQVELSMTGVPYTTGSEIDVVIMLDITGSMHDVTSSTYTYSQYTRVEATIIATMEFVKSIVVNEDGTYNNNRVGVYSFNAGGTYTLWELGKVTDLATINAAIQKFNDNYKSGGTPYDDGLSKVQSVLNTAKTDGTGNNRQQFAVFMTDGVPTDYEYVTTSGHSNYSSASSIAGMLTSSDNYCTRDTDYYYEYYSTEMKKAGVTVYSVGIGLENTNSAWSGTAAQCLNLASRLLNDISGPAGETTQPDAVGTSTLSKQDSYFFSVDDANAATDMKNVFTNIAVKILQAATDVTVEDKITDEYTMIFDIPTGSKEISGVTNDFYIEFLKYTLDANHERVDTDGDGDTYDDATSVTKLYLGKSDGKYFAASDSNGTAYAAPVFENKTIGDKGTLYYWTTDSSYASDAALSYNDGTNTYYFYPYGIDAEDDDYDSSKWFNMTSGAYAYGTVDSTNMSQDLVIATPYFVYNAATRMLYWTVDKIDTTEYALRYFLYLERSATEVGTTNETDPGSYKTNEYAYLTYTNFQGNDCRQEFVKPQMTWSGAQVSYVFYLVNAQGQPINRSGQVVDFANAVFVTDIYTEDTVWNKGEDGQITADSELSIDWLANELLPSDYLVYDENAGYELHVYGDHTGESIFDYFTIEGSTAADISNSLNSRLDLETTATTVSLTTTKVYNTKAGTKITGYGTYTSKATDSISGETVLNNFDFYNTTVAFAVVWQPKLVEDTVVVDFGLDVLINVVENDILQNKVTGIGVGNSAYGNIAMNTGVSTTSKLGTAALTIDGNTISIENENQIRFHQGDMLFDEPVVFYYESPVEFYEGSDKKEGFMYSRVTVIPATTIYYEDSFISNNDLKSYEWDNTTNDWKDPTTGTGDGTFDWKQDGTAVNGTQDQDRPGKSQISELLDADNNYGYDAAYKSMSTYSMGAALKVHVDYDHMATASFSFWGTGFDVISMTTNTTGTIIVNVYDSTDNLKKSFTVNTYYGMAYVDGEWETTTTADPNALYQVPVMKISDLTYGQYRAEIKVVYDPIFDQGLYEDASYDFYLDAIRIYDPTGNQNNDANNAYVADGEGWPAYTELRNMVLGADEVASIDGTVSGVVFIDGANPDLGQQADVTDYTNYGPNNELYLAQNQSIAFKLTAIAVTGTEIAGIQLGIKSVGTETGHIVIKDGDGNEYLDMDVATATEMYYDITALNGKNVIITSTGDAIISLTNVKVTYTGSQVTSDNADPANDTSSAVPASVMNVPAITMASTSADYTVTTDDATAETETYLLSVNAETVACALRVLNAEEEVEPEEPVVPEEPVIPEEPETPEEPVVPEEPETPEEPEEPVVPEKPGKPGKPQKPNKPIQPENPGKPGNPIKPVRPVKPGKPSNPSKPGKPGMPVLPGNPVKPGFSGAVVFY